MKHLLIDYENIQPNNLDKLSEEQIHIWLFLGAIHKNLPIELVQSLLKFGERVHLVRLNKSGKNALDFYLSYYLGQITATDAHAEIAILSRDGGYDILLEHILDNHQADAIIRLADLDNVQNNIIESTKIFRQPETLSVEKTVTPLTPYFQAALTALRQPNAFRPTRLANLQQNLQKYVLAELLADQSDEEREQTIHNVLSKLKSRKFIVVDESENITYHVDDADLLARIQVYILSLRPQSYADFQAAVKTRADALALNVNDSDIQAFARYLREQNLIRQNSGKIEYAPFKDEKQSAQPIVSNQKYQPDAAVWQKILAMIDVNKINRPTTIKALQNVIKSHIKCSDDEMDKLQQHLIVQKYLKLNGDKIEYAPFDEDKSTKPVVSNQKYQPDAAIWKKILAALNTEHRHRPSKLTALRNHLKSCAKCDNAEVENLIQYLITQKYLKLDEQKIVYLK